MLQRVTRESARRCWSGVFASAFRRCPHPYRTRAADATSAWVTIVTIPQKAKPDGDPTQSDTIRHFLRHIVRSINCASRCYAICYEPIRVLRTVRCVGLPLPAMGTWNGTGGGRVHDGGSRCVTRRRIRRHGGGWDQVVLVCRLGFHGYHLADQASRLRERVVRPQPTSEINMVRGGRVHGSGFRAGAEGRTGVADREATENVCPCAKRAGRPAVVEPRVRVQQNATRTGMTFVDQTTV
jgi:hypothetical protein